MDDIENRCLINFKEKTMWRNFEIHHVPSSEIPAPHATSPSTHDQDDDANGDEYTVYGISAALKNIA